MSSPESPIRSLSPNSPFYPAPRSPAEQMNHLTRRTNVVAPSIILPTTSEQTAPLPSVQTFDSLDDYSPLEIVEGLLDNNDKIFDFLRSPESPLLDSVTLNFMERRKSDFHTDFSKSVRIKLIYQFFERNPLKRETVCGKAKKLFDEKNSKYSSEENFLQTALSCLEKAIKQPKQTAETVEVKTTTPPHHRRQISNTFDGEPGFEW